MSARKAKAAPDDLSALVDISNELNDLLQDLETVTMAIAGAARDASFDVATVACTSQRLAYRLGDTLAKVDELRGTAKAVTS